MLIVTLTAPRVSRRGGFSTASTSWSPESVSAQTDQFETIPFLRFDGDALGTFREMAAGLGTSGSAQVSCRRAWKVIWRSVGRSCRAVSLMIILQMVGWVRFPRLPSNAVSPWPRDARNGTLGGPMAPARRSRQQQPGPFSPGSETRTQEWVHGQRHLPEPSVRSLRPRSDTSRARPVTDFDWFEAAERETGGRPSVVYSMIREVRNDHVPRAPGTIEGKDSGKAPTGSRCLKSLSPLDTLDTASGRHVSQIEGSADQPRYPLFYTDDQREAARRDAERLGYAEAARWPSWGYQEIAAAREMFGLGRPACSTATPRSDHALGALPEPQDRAGQGLWRRHGEGHWRW